MVNGKFHWTQIADDEDMSSSGAGTVGAIWYDQESNVWVFGWSSDRGSNDGRIRTLRDVPCPTGSDKKFEYRKFQSTMSRKKEERERQEEKTPARKKSYGMSTPSTPKDFNFIPTPLTKSLSYGSWIPAPIKSVVIQCVQ